MHIVPIASGKGGVGKSLFTANLGIALAQSGRKVILIDLDLGGSNLHLILGVRRYKHSIGHFLNTPRMKLSELLTQTEYANLAFIPGDAEVPGLANITAAQKNRIIRQINQLDADYVLLDLGAGSHTNTIEFFLASSHGIMITNPTPTALVNAYLFIKSSIFHLLNKSARQNSPGERFLKGLQKDADNMQRIYIIDLLKQLAELDPDCYEQFKRTAGRFMPRLVLNMLEDPKDSDKVTKLRRSVQQYLGMDMEHLGVMYRDDVQDIALGSRLPIIIYKPKSILSQAIYRIADKIMQLEDESDDSLIAFDDFDDSYDVAESEARVDFASRMEYIEELLHSGTLTPGDLVETVKSQQIEINALKRENAFIKKKLVEAAELGFDV
jgi:flagellar biosynthesis protein FlhG